MVGLDRFIAAQERDYEIALQEIKSGKKRSHWMWYIFPQLRGLGKSSTAEYYAIENMDEAKAFIKHPLLGKRLIKICEMLLTLDTSDAYAIFGNPDDLKLHSCMTLFDAIHPSDTVFTRVLVRFFKGEKDQLTMRLLDN